MVKAGLQLGIMGGTFNPIHFGHLRAAEEIFQLMNLTRFVFIPAAKPPHKNSKPVIPFIHRWEMVRRAVASRPGFYVSDVEGRRRGPSFTVETLEFFHREFDPGLNIFFVTGLDAFLEIHTWKDYPQLFKLASFVVTTRPGSDPRLLTPYVEETVPLEYTWDEDRNLFFSQEAHPIHFQPVSWLDVSSTGLRSGLARGDSIRYLTPERVREYILANRLYQT